MFARASTWSVVSLVLFGCVLAAPAAADPPPATPATKPSVSGRVFEMRKYYTVPGRLDALHARFRNHTTRLFEKHGMENIGYWTPTEGPEAGKVLIYLLAHSSIEAKEASWKGFRGDPEWKTVREDSEKDGKIVEKVESTILSATDYSKIK
jgi:hypothetical protein